MHLVRAAGSYRWRAEWKEPELLFPLTNNLPTGEKDPALRFYWRQMELFEREMLFKKAILSDEQSSRFRERKRFKSREYNSIGKF